jgi:hypothetical protein
MAWVRRLSAMLVPTLSDKGCHMVSMTDSLRPYSRLPKPELYQIYFSITLTVCEITKQELFLYACMQHSIIPDKMQKIARHGILMRESLRGEKSS